jgi:3-oxoacyl-[acyl-carrier protein] reductase
MSNPAPSRVLVTGAGRGIGAACARAFARAGAKVACADIDPPEHTVSTIADAGGKAAGHSCDVADEPAVLALFERLASDMGGLDGVVHCAGIIHERPLLETSVAEFDQVIAVNLRGSFLIGREAIRMMRDSGGRVILTASDLAYAGRETFSPYVASKHGVLGLVRSWAHEFAPHILVNALCPGPIDTHMLAAEQMTQEWREKELAIPLARFGDPDEVAELAVFLAGPGGAFITGQGIGVNGGSVMP